MNRSSGEVVATQDRFVLAAVLLLVALIQRRGAEHLLELNALLKPTG